MNRRPALLAIATVMFVALGTAAAEDADALFQSGKRLLAEKKYAEACKAFHEVDKIDPGIGAKLNVARCFEEWGRLATAYHWYASAEKMAIDTRDDRAAKISELMKSLDARVPRLVLRSSAPAAISDVAIDDEPVAGAVLDTDLRVDAGPHTISYKLDGERRTQAVTISGTRTEATLAWPAVTGVSGAATTTATAPAPGRTRRIIGLSVTGGGVVMMGIAGIITLGAKSKYNDALDEHCMGSTTMCNEQGLALTHDARSTANIATVITVIGGAAVIGGVVLYLTAPKRTSGAEHAIYVSPVVGHDSAAVVVGGRY
ncbi:MAG: hypothetical protein AB7P03_01300 [Kofleriaceae bacterium]